MSEHSDFVKGLADRYTAKYRNYKDDDPDRAEGFIHTAKQLMAAAEEIDRLINLTTAIPKNLGDLSDLPAELVDELSLTKVDELEHQIVTVINACDGVANIDQILVGLYRKFKVTQKRRFLQNKLYRMMKSDVIFSVPGKKGLYSTEEQELEDDQPSTSLGTDFSQDFDDEIPF